MSSLGNVEGVEHWRITAKAEVQFSGQKIPSLDERVDAIKKAWIAVRRQHPTLAAISTAGQMRCRTIGADEDEIERWVHATFFVHEDMKFNDKLGDQFKAGDQARLHYLPMSGELVIQIRHAHTDGRGMFMLFGCLLDALGKILNSAEDPYADVGTGQITLSPAFHIAANIPDQATDEQLKCMETKLKKWTEGFPSLGVFSPTLNAEPSICAIERMMYSPEESSAIISAAKRLHFTVTHVMHAAMILGAKEHSNLTVSETNGAVDPQMAEIASSDNYLTSGVHDLRFLCEPKYQSHPVVSYHLGWPMLITLAPPSERTLVSTAGQIKAWYNAEKDDVVGLLPTLPQYVKSLKALIAEEAESGVASTSPHLSSMGIADKYLRKEYGTVGGTLVRVKDYWAQTETVTPDLEVVCLSLQGRIHLCISYNTAFHSAESMRRYLDLVRKQLLQGLNISV